MVNSWSRVVRESRVASEEKAEKKEQFKVWVQVSPQCQNSSVTEGQRGEEGRERGTEVQAFSSVQEVSLRCALWHGGFCFSHWHMELA